MYRLLIADDEALEREGLEWIVNRMLPDKFEIIHAENGRRAIEQAEERRPHIVLMDVQMPGIQGLEALKEIRGLLPGVKLVLVTAFDSFAYAQEAIALGVSEYIVKPASRDQVANLLTRLIRELDQERDKRAEQLELMNRMSTIQPLIENELALILMIDQVLDASPKQLSEWIDFPLDDCRCAVIAFTGHDPAFDRKPIYETIRRLAKAQGSCIVSSILERHLALFLHKPTQAADDWKEEPVRFAGKLAEAAGALLGTAPSVGIGTLRSGPEGLRRSYFEAVFASTVPGPAGQVCLFDDLKQSGEAERQADAAAAETPQRSYVMSALHRIRELREEQTSSVMDRAVGYILRRFAEDLSLEDAAEYVHLNPFYFSKVFKQHVGETFIDYVTGLRIDKAKRLLEEDSGLILKEVCYQVGYNDPNYFSRVFKKVTGVTPSEYRSQQSR